MEREFTVQDAQKFAELNRIEEWVDEFLRGPGNNVALANGLRTHERYWFGPSEFALSDLVRCCGPEKGMRYHTPRDDWERKTDAMAAHVSNGGVLPPLIIEFVQGTLSIADGNHRHEALTKAGVGRYWTIVWFNNQGDFNKFVSARN